MVRPKKPIEPPYSLIQAAGDKNAIMVISIKWFENKDRKSFIYPLETDRNVIKELLKDAQKAKRTLFTSETKKVERVIGNFDDLEKAFLEEEKLIKLQKLPKKIKKVDVESQPCCSSQLKQHPKETIKTEKFKTKAAETQESETLPKKKSYNVQLQMASQVKNAFPHKRNADLDDNIKFPNDKHRLSLYNQSEDGMRSMTLDDAKTLQQNIEILLTNHAHQIKQDILKIIARESILSTNLMKEINNNIVSLGEKKNKLTLTCPVEITDQNFPISNYPDLEQFCDSLKSNQYKTFKIEQVRKVALITATSTAVKCVSNIIRITTTEDLRLSCNFAGKSGKETIPKVPVEYGNFIESCMVRVNPSLTFNVADINGYMKRFWNQTRDTFRKRIDRIKVENEVEETEPKSEMEMTSSDSD